MVLPVPLKLTVIPSTSTVLVLDVKVSVSSPFLVRVNTASRPSVSTLSSPSDSAALPSGQVNRSNGYASEGELPALGGSLKLQTAKGTYNVSLSSAGAKTNHEALEKFAEKINSLNAGVTASVTKKDGKSYQTVATVRSSDAAAILSALPLMTLSAAASSLDSFSKC